MSLKHVLTIMIIQLHILLNEYVLFCL